MVQDYQILFQCMLSVIRAATPTLSTSRECLITHVGIFSAV